ncbi:unnamed protein product [Nippostrongylus brasiliensis]|uniref:C2H2-type domain-containing protein n=1 Tax=Nippostrongylus brasiliensis TaxID=27835 RepID=A0A0N4Y582_NIPBR|nr:unnamed protein product [Nippostrongylus brasiliensis]
MEGTLAKKPRVWNPAVDNDNYFHLARVQQQRVVEEAFRRGFMPAFPVQTIPPIVPRGPAVPAMMRPPSQAIASMMPSTVSAASTSSSAVSSASSNPLVQSALGVVAMTNENCCAICGSAFRLTADLVQHMRNNHRRTRFKRKNEKPYV